MLYAEQVLFWSQVEALEWHVGDLRNASIRIRRPTLFYSWQDHRSSPRAGPAPL